MKIKNIKFSKKVNLKNITVIMSIEEAAWFAKVIGNITSVNSKIHNEMYRCLVSELFNKHYYDGVDEAIKELGVVIPKQKDIKLP